MFLHVSVILFTWGVSLRAYWDTTPPPGSRHPLAADTPAAVHAGRHGQQAGGTHPTGMYYCSVNVMRRFTFLYRLDPDH